MISRIIHVIATLFAVILTLLTILLSPLGLKMSLQAINLALPGKLSYNHVGGVLIGPIDITKLEYRAPDKIIRIKHFHLNWSPSTLLINRFTLDDLNINGVEITLRSGSTEKAPAETPPQLAIPFSVAISSINISDITVKNEQGKMLAKLGSISLNALIKPERMKINLSTELSAPQKIRILANVDGKPSNYTLDLNATGEGFDWEIKGNGDNKQFQWKVTKAKLLSGQLTGDSQIQFAPDFKWNINLKGSRLNLYAIDKQLPKSMDLRFTSQGKIDQQGHSTYITTLNTPNNQIVLHGKYENEPELKWEIRINQLSELLSDSRGTIVSSGQLTGDPKEPSSTGTIALKNFAWSGNGASSMEATWNIKQAGISDSQVTLKGTDLAMHQLKFTKANFVIKGNRDKHSIDAHWNTAYTDVNAQLNGTVLKKTWRATVNKFLIHSSRYGNWALQKNIAFYIAPNAFHLDDFCMTSQHGNLCAGAEWNQNKPWRAKLIGRNVSLEMFAFAFPKTIDLAGVMTIDLQANGLENWVKQAKLDVKVSEGRFRFHALKRTVQSAYRGGSLNAEIDKKGVRAKLQLSLPGNNAIDANFNLPSYVVKGAPLPNQRIKGNVVLNWQQLNTLVALITSEVQPKGNLYANLQIAGTVNKPKLEGSANIRNGILTIPNHGIELKNIKIDVKAHENAFEYGASVTSAGRQLTFRGKTSLDLGFPTTATLTGDNVLTVNTPTFILYLTPKLTVKTKGHELWLSGSFEIPKGNIQPETIRNTVKVPDADITYIGLHKHAPKKQWKIHNNIKIKIGNDVKINTTGLVGKVRGSLDIMSEPLGPIFATGDISVHDATYSAYGNELIIESGSSIFYTHTPIDNPNLNVRAYKEFATTGSAFGTLVNRKIIVGLHLGGSLRHPDVNLYSTPSMLSQADILSYLLLGGPANANSPGNFTLLMLALEALEKNPQGDTPKVGLTQQIQKGLGLSEFGVESQSALNMLGNPLPEQSMSFVVGRFLTPSIYLRYSYGLNNDNSVLQVRYMFRRNWAIQVESSTAGNGLDGLDVLYTTESD